MIVWNIAGAHEKGGWSVYGLFTTRQRALEFAATVPEPVYLFPLRTDQRAVWDGTRCEGIATLVTPELLQAAGIET